MASRFPPPLAYWLGLVAQILTDATPHGLTLASLCHRAQLDELLVSDVLRVGLRHQHVRRDGDRYFAA